MNPSPHRQCLLALTACFGLACSSAQVPAGGGAAGNAGAPGGGGGAVAGNGGASALAGNVGVSGNAQAGNVATSGAAGTLGAAGAGGAGGSAGLGGAGGGSAGSTSATGCSGVSAKFCDDFEAAQSGAAPSGDFTVNAKAGSMLVDGSKPFSGKQSLHISSPKPSATAFLEFSKQFPMNDFHGRAMLYMARIPTAEIHWDIIDAVSDNGQHWEIGGMYGKFIFVVDPPDHALTSNAFPTGKWVCLQWEFKYGGQGGDNSFLAKLDGAVLDKGQFTGPDPDNEIWAAGVWNHLSLGYTGYGMSDVDIEEWIDDLAIGDAPIACPAP